jgi:hypothetical protein
MVGMVVTVIVRKGITTTTRWSFVTFHVGSIVIRFHFSVRSRTMIRVGMVVCMSKRRRISHSVAVVIAMMVMRRHSMRRVRMRLVRILMVRKRVTASILMMVIVQ